MTNEQYLDAFKKKQGFKNHKQIDDIVHAFDGYYFDIQDIITDVSKEVTAGTILLYHDEAMDGWGLPPYNVWLIDHGYAN